MKFLRVNLTTSLIAEEQIPERYVGLGGRGLTSIMINDQVPADCDPLGEENLLIFAPGFLSGTPLANTGRLSIGAKSPLTGGIKESNVGGAMAAALSRQGIRAVIVEGKAPENALYHLNHSRVPTIKGQSIAGYDPRAMPGMGVTYATSPMGGDHTAGFVGAASGSIDTLRNASKSSQVHMAATDSMGLCMFAQSGGMDNLFRAISALAGKPFDSQTWQQLGTRILTAEIDFNRRAGLTNKDHRLPDMFHQESLSPHYGTVPYPENDLHGTFAAIRQTLIKNEENRTLHRL